MSHLLVKTIRLGHGVLLYILKMCETGQLFSFLAVPIGNTIMTQT